MNGNGTQQIVSNSYEFYKPNQLLINGILQNDADYYVYNLTKNINIITMRCNEKLTTFNSMFKNLENITDFDFSNFDTSNVKDMASMFYNVNSLKTLDLSNFNTKK